MPLKKIIQTLLPGTSHRIYTEIANLSTGLNQAVTTAVTKIL